VTESPPLPEDAHQPATPTPEEPEAPENEGLPRSRQRTDRVLIERIERQKTERLRASREPAGSLWRTVAQVGTLGWLIALPPVLGAFLGHLIDMRLDTGITWAIGLLFLGLGMGGYFFWRTIQEAEENGA